MGSDERRSASAAWDAGIDRVEGPCEMGEAAMVITIDSRALVERRVEAIG